MIRRFWEAEHASSILAVQIILLIGCSMANLLKETLFLSDGDTIKYKPTGQIGIIIREHNPGNSSESSYELKLLDPDKKIWASGCDIELLFAVG